MKLYIFICILTIIFILGCIAPVKWVKRKGGTPEEETWVPVCPYCNHVVDYGSLQCSNPKCRALLTWNTKTVYANKLYLEEDNNNDSIKEKNNANIKIQKRKKHRKRKNIEKIKDQKKETNSSKDKSKNFKNVIKNKNNNKISNKTSRQKQKNKDENKNKKEDDEWNFEEDEW